MISPREWRTLASCFSHTSRAIIRGAARVAADTSAHVVLRPNPSAEIHRGDVADHIHVIDGVDAKIARGELLEIRPLRDIIGEHDRLRRIVTQDFFRGGALKVAREAGVGALAEAHQILRRWRGRAEYRGRDQTKGERAGAAPLLHQVVADGRAAAQGTDWSNACWSNA